MEENCQYISLNIHIITPFQLILYFWVTFEYYYIYYHNTQIQEEENKEKCTKKYSYGVFQADLKQYGKNGSLVASFT